MRANKFRAKGIKKLGQRSFKIRIQFHKHIFNNPKVIGNTRNKEKR